MEATDPPAHSFPLSVPGAVNDSGHHWIPGLRSRYNIGDRKLKLLVTLIILNLLIEIK